MRHNSRTKGGGKNLRRRTFNFTAAVSLLLFIAAAGLWVCGPKDVTVGNYSGLGCLSALRGYGFWYTHYVPHTWHRYWWSWGKFYIWISSDVGVPVEESGDPYLQVSIQYWFVAVVTAFLPTLWLLNFAFHRRKDQGLCSICDYDLTGNVSGICPECGTPIRSSLQLRGRRADGGRKRGRVRSTGATRKSD